jgi:NAD+ synthase
VRALGPSKVLGVVLPEREGSVHSTRLAYSLAERCGVETVTEDISPMLESSGCYRRRDAVIRRIFPQYAPGWKSKISLPGSLLDQDQLDIFSLTVVDLQGNGYQKFITPSESRLILAALKFKQRARMSMLYYHAECRDSAVIGSANKNEHELGFFVKYGDGGVDVSPVEHLFKSQVYQLARYLGIPEEIQRLEPKVSEFSADCSQQELYFRLPFEMLDLIWAGYEQGVAPQALSEILNLSVEQVDGVIQDIIRKQRTTEYLRRMPLRL